MTHAVYRYEVPVDDAWHAIDLTGPVLHVDCRQVDVVEFWAIARPGLASSRRDHFRVFATGEPVGGVGSVEHVGTAIAPGLTPLTRPTDRLVWHLFRAAT